MRDAEERTYRDTAYNLFITLIAWHSMVREGKKRLSTSDSTSTGIFSPSKPHWAPKHSQRPHMHCPVSTMSVDRLPAFLSREPSSLFPNRGVCEKLRELGADRVP